MAKRRKLYREELIEYRNKALEQLAEQASKLGMKNTSRGGLYAADGTYWTLGRVSLRLDGSYGESSGWGRGEPHGWNIDIQGPLIRDRIVVYQQKDDGSFNWEGIAEQVRSRVEKDTVDKDLKQTQESYKEMNKHLASKLSRQAQDSGLLASDASVEPSGSAMDRVVIRFEGEYCLDEAVATELLKVLAYARINRRI